MRTRSVMRELARTAVATLLLTGASGAAWSQSTRPSPGGAAYDDARKLADKIRENTQAGQAPAGPNDALPKADPCALLTAAEVARYFPKAGAAERERSREKYGIAACMWNHPAGRFVLQLTLADPGTTREETEGLVAGFVDPLRPGAGKAVRVERVPGVGDEAWAVVEKKDDKAGILSDVAYLYTQRGRQMLGVMAVDLARGDRAAALKALGELGRLAAARL